MSSLQISLSPVESGIVTLRNKDELYTIDKIMLAHNEPGSKDGLSCSMTLDKLTHHKKPKRYKT
jgi:hypothetical protein